MMRATTRPPTRKRTPRRNRTMRRDRETLRTGVLRSLQTREALEEAAGATALQQLRAHGAQSLNRIKEEDRLAMKQLGGNLKNSEGDDMGDVNIGDHFHPAQPNALNQLIGKALVAAAIAIPAAVVAWKALDHKPSPVIQQPNAAPTLEDTDTVTELRIYRND